MSQHAINSLVIIYYFLKNQYCGVSLRYNTHGREPFVEFIFHYIFVQCPKFQKKLSASYILIHSAALPLPHPSSHIL